MRHPWRLASQMAAIACLAFALFDCAAQPREGTLRLPNVGKEAAWKATREVLQSHYSLVDADPVAGTLKTDYHIETNPLYRHRLTARVSQDEVGRTIVDVLVVREKLSAGFRDYGEGFEKGTWTRVEDDGGLGEVLLREISNRAVAK